MDKFTRTYRFYEEAERELATANSPVLKRYWSIKLNNAETDMDIIAQQIMNEDAANE